MAAKLLSESAGSTRFRGEATFARHGGLAPIPVWSGNTAGRVRMTRSGDRQINCAIHRIAIAQVRLKHSPGRAYYDKKLVEGKTKTEALRSTTTCPRRVPPPDNRPQQSSHCLPPGGGLT